MLETVRLPEVEITVKVRTRFAIDQKRAGVTFFTRVSAQPWIPLYTIKSRTRLPDTVAAELIANPQLVRRLETIFKCGLAPQKHRPGFEPVPLPLIDAMPEQLMHAAAMALPMMLAAICNYLGLPQVELNLEIDSHAGNLRRALKDNLGVTSPGHPQETKEEFIERIKLAAAKVLPTLNGKAPKQNELANELGWDPSYLRARQRKHGVKDHTELLRLLGIRQSLSRG